ncbi:hypothetical protein EG805_23545 [Escherichia coli]|nr:hypothetical protein [Escherichia coli]EEV9163660.1 hypothetical protein [Escherichia coli]EEV9244617.1 hypothetical protein [Escherichia coli]EEY6133377.1 hypothetical protein [Escherichia coli]EFB3267075.1 hypothetical protein [Escherichia coli]
MAGLSGWRFRVFEVASDRPLRKYGRFRQKLPVKTDIRKNSARRRPVTGRSPRTGEEAQCIYSYREQVRPEALS